MALWIEHLNNSFLNPDIKKLQLFHRWLTIVIKFSMGYEPFSEGWTYEMCPTLKVCGEGMEKLCYCAFFI